MQSDPSSLLSLPPRKRGEYANKFRKTEIITNHFEVNLRNTLKVVIYSIKFSPSISRDDIKTRTTTYNKYFRAQVDEKIGKSVLGGHNVFSSQECNQALQITAGGYTVTITQRKVYEVGAKPEVLRQFLNNSLKDIMRRANYAEIGKAGKYFNTNRQTAIDNLIMYKGYCSAFNEMENGVFLRVDTANKIVRKDSAMKIIDQIYFKFKNLEKEEKRNQVRKSLINTIVMTNYNNPTFYRVLDVNFNTKINDVKVEGHDNLKEYYRTKYSIEIINEKQPLLLVENKIRRRQLNGQENPTYLLPELCQMTGIPDDFDENRRKKISEQTIRPPNEKYEEIQGFVRELKERKELETFSEMGIHISQKMNRMQAKQIGNPTLELGEKKTVEKGKEAFFSLFANPIFQAKHGVFLVIIHNKNTEVKPMVETFTKTARNLKVELEVKCMPEYLNSEGDVIKAIDKALESFSKCNILMPVLPSKLQNAYPGIKSATLEIAKKREILTQCVVEHTLRKKGVQSIHTKLLLQILAKRGNILWVPSYKEQISQVLNKTMIVGIDSGSKAGVSVLAACGTINSTFSSHATATVITSENKNDQKYQSMLEVTMKCVSAYTSRNKDTPKELIVFMNTSPGDQINLYQENYSQKLKERVKSTFNKEVDLTVVMVNLRNSERFFTTDAAPRNVFPGTLVSNTIVSKNYDFYIVSQQSRSGCTVPNHYKVITCDSKLEQGHLQELIFSQCFNYVNWTGSIKIPAVLQYAKKCARFNAEVTAGKILSEGLQVRPYYI